MFWIRNTSNKYPKVIKLLDINPFALCGPVDNGFDGAPLD
jgi:hypothetical protein